MKQAVFITGFNNWGKTSIIQHLFNERQKYYLGGIYQIDDINAAFTVESHSNDDWWGQSWVERVHARILNENADNLNLFTALCPTIHDNNNFVDLLSIPPFTSYEKLHVFLIEYKWEHHAKLIIDNIVTEGKKNPKINFVTINADQNQISDNARLDAKINQIINELKRIFN